MAKIVAAGAAQRLAPGSISSSKTRVTDLLTQSSLLNDALQKRFDALGGARFFGALEKKDGRT